MVNVHHTHSILPFVRQHTVNAMNVPLEASTLQIESNERGILSVFIECESKHRTLCSLRTIRLSRDRTSDGRWMVITFNSYSGGAEELKSHRSNTWTAIPINDDRLWSMIYVFVSIDALQSCKIFLSGKRNEEESKKKSMEFSLDWWLFKTRHVLLGNRVVFNSPHATVMMRYAVRAPYVCIGLDVLMLTSVR